MEHVAQLNPAGAAPRSPASAAAADADADAEKAATDFETFLTLLTAQLRNQDPLQPIESTQFVAQLASFSSVEQQVKTNALLSELTSSMAGNSPERLVGLIGKEVPAPLAAVYADRPVDIRFQPVTTTDVATLVVRNDAGTAVGQVPVDPASGAAQWDGTLTNGFAVSGASYSFDIEISDANGVIASQPGLVFSPVRQIRFDTGGPQLGFAGGVEIALSEVLQIRAPGG